MQSPPDVIHLGVADVLCGHIERIREAFPSTVIAGTITFRPAIGNATQRTLEPVQTYGRTDCRCSSSQQRFFAHEFPGTAVVMVPHGVDTDFFRPLPYTERSPAAGPRVIFAGVHMRDFETLAKVVSAVIGFHSTVGFDLVVPRAEQTQVLQGLADAFPGRIVLHDKVPSAELLRLYQQAHAALLPLTDSTANNSILEALACGTPVITTDVGGTGDYVTKECGFLVPRGDTRLYVDSLMTLLGQGETRRRMSDRARARAEELSWDRVAKTMTGVYRDMYAARHS